MLKPFVRATARAHLIQALCVGAAKNIEADIWEGDATKHFSEEKGFSVGPGGGGGNSAIFFFVLPGKAIRWRGPGESVNRLTLKDASRCPHPLPDNQVLINAGSDGHATTAFPQAIAVRKRCNEHIGRVPGCVYRGKERGSGPF